MFRKLAPKARQPEYMVGEDGERLCESLHISVLDYDLPVTHEQKAFDTWIDLITRTTVY